MLAYALTIFTGSFLLFQVQPLIAKYLLPWFGGGPGVWTTCLFFFQAFLLAGYAYAHALTHYFGPKAQRIIHLALLAAALASLPIVPSEAWKPRGPDHPFVAIFSLLTVKLALSYSILASTSPLLQRWFGGLRHAPYGLYALSNVGSLLALLTYPILFEAHLSRQSQATFWECGLFVYCACCAFCALRSLRGPIDQPDVAFRPRKSEATTADVRPSSLFCSRALWLLWPACASVLLLAITNKLCLDVAVVPLLWVLPLGVYLLSFIFCFSGTAWYPRLPFTIILAAGMALLCWALFSGAGWPFWKQACVYTGTLFVCCMVCHGELFRIRPGPERLTEFYLLSAAGGAVGGLCVSVAAPVIFTNYYELHWGLALLAVLVLGVRTSESISFLVGSITAKSGQARPSVTLTRKWRREAARVGLSVLWIAFLSLAATLWLQARHPGHDVVQRSRNFYGVLTVFEHRKDEPKGRHLLLQHGRITHGFQFVDPQLQTLTTTYYGPDSGLGLALNALPAGNRRIGVIGLGAGTIAAYARPGDYVRFYEINPEVIRLACSRFTYLNQCGGKCDIRPGDARLSLEQEPAQEFDILIIDAFNSDSIPVHLLTREAFEIYLRHLKPQGTVAVHISNHFLRLDPVVAGLARHFGLQTAFIDHDARPEQWWIYSSTWMLLSRDGSILEAASIRQAAKPGSAPDTSLPLWKDDFTSLFRILR